MSAGHGPNIGHGFVKYVVIDQTGAELPPIVFPAITARAGRQVSGALVRVESVEAAGERWWVGEDALLSPSPLTVLAQERLSDPAFLPALLRGALRRLGGINGSASGTCVTGLPATWATDPNKARQLGDRLRAATGQYRGIKVIAEPLGLVYSALLDNQGEIAGDAALSSGSIAVADLGHHTVDTAVIRQLAPLPSGLNTFTLGTARPLREIRARLSTAFERELSLYETDMAVRAGALAIGGSERPLPSGWDQPLRENGAASRPAWSRSGAAAASSTPFCSVGAGLRSRGWSRRSRLTSPMLSRFPARRRPLPAVMPASRAGWGGDGDECKALPPPTEPCPASAGRRHKPQRQRGPACAPAPGRELRRIRPLGVPGRSGPAARRGARSTCAGRDRRPLWIR